MGSNASRAASTSSRSSPNTTSCAAASTRTPRRTSCALNGKSFHILNRVLDEAIGLAVQTFATQQSLEVQRRRDEYLAFITHDLRTPLSAISMAARVLEMNPPETETGPMLRTLRRNLKHLETLVDRVLKESAHIQSDANLRLERRQFDLWPLVEALIHDLQPVAGTSTTRLVNAVPEDLMAFADASLIRRVFQNLIANAITFTPRGEVTIGARDVARQAVSSAGSRTTAPGSRPNSSTASSTS